jgi:organic radical activating enzyme
MKRIVEIKNTQSRIVRINYDLGNVCNYSCWYCFPGSHEGDVPWPNADVVKRNLVKIVNHYKLHADEVQVAFLGGEPTLWKELGDVVEYVAKNSECKIYIITNGSRTLRWWNEYGGYFDNVSISVHHQRVDVDHIIKLANLLETKNTTYFADVLMDHTAWYKCVDIVNQLSSAKNKFAVFAKPIQLNGVTMYNDAQREYLSKSLKQYPSIKFILRNFRKLLRVANTKITAIFDDGSKETTRNENYFNIHMLNKFKGWNCNIGVDLVFINRQGKLTGACNQRLFDLDFEYNINDADFSFSPKIKPAVCEQEFCMCPGEAALAKRKVWPIIAS